MTSAAHLIAHRSLLARCRALLGRRSLLLSAAPAAALAMTVTTGASAAPVWTGDFETGNLSQWNTSLNGEHITVVTSPVLQGTRAGQIQLTNDAVWPSNGIKRVELNHKPAAGRTAEGAQTYFAWSFYLPEALAADPPTQIGYWESDATYNQMMSFEVVGQRISFATRKPNNKVHWEANGAVTPGVWHRIALHVRWSTNPSQGSVDVWFDGEQVVTAGQAQTLADNNAHFTQLGLLRNPAEFTDSPIIVLDDAVEGDTLEDVRPELPSTGEGGAGGAGGGGTGGADNTGGAGATTSASASTSTSTSTGAGTGGGAASGSGASTSAASGAGATGSGSGAGGADEGGDEGDEGGCSYRAVGSSAPAPAAIAGLLVALAFARRRERR